jgi:hypothetical protein
MPSGEPYVALTYANDLAVDGGGAQLHRIYGIYAIARWLNLPYVHSPILRIQYQGLTALEDNSDLPDFESRWNQAFAIPSDIDMPERYTAHSMRDADPDRIKQLQVAANIRREFALIRILHPHSVTDRNPELYRHVRAISPFPEVRSDLFRLAIHVRRGELFAIESGRMMPNSYYVSYALAFIEAFQRLGIPFICELYTEVVSKEFVLTQEHRGLLSSIGGNRTMTPAMSQLEDFSVLPNLVPFLNGDPIETLRGMATADALILSRSSFSYVAAILNANGIIVYHPFWHRSLKDWVIGGEDFQAPRDEIMARVEGWSRVRVQPIGGSAG